MDEAVKMAALVADLCRATETPYLPLFEAWSGQTDLDARLADGLHLNSSGYEWLFRKVSAFLERLPPQDEVPGYTPDEAPIISLGLL